MDGCKWAECLDWQLSEVGSLAEISTLKKQAESLIRSAVKLMPKETPMVFDDSAAL